MNKLRGVSLLGILQECGERARTHDALGSLSPRKSVIPLASMRFDAYSVWCGKRCQAACTTYSRLSMSPSMYLCVGDIQAIFNCLAAGGPDSKVALLMDNNSPFLVVEFVVIEQAY
jgi:hypothetical protein